MSEQEIKQMPNQNLGVGAPPRPMGPIVDAVLENRKNVLAGIMALKPGARGVTSSQTSAAAGLIEGWDRNETQTKIASDNIGLLERNQTAKPLALVDDDEEDAPLTPKGIGVGGTNITNVLPKAKVPIGQTFSIYRNLTR